MYRNPWLTDGSPGFVTMGSTVKLTSNGGLGNIYNAIWRDGDRGVSSGQHYWQIHFPNLRSEIVVGSTGVGFTSREYFTKGYACKSIVYNGDLNASGMQDRERGRVVANFGPKIKDGDTVGLLVVFENHRLKVYIDVSGTSLGLAFDILASSFTSIYPLVSFHFDGSATCGKYLNIPTGIKSRRENVFPGILGPWKLTKFDGTAIPYPVAPDCVLSLTSSTKPDEYTWRIDQFRAFLIHANGTWKSRNIILPQRKSTKGVNPEKDKKYYDLINGVNNVELDDTGHLCIRSTNISTTWIRPTVSGLVGSNLFEAYLRALAASTSSSDETASTSSSAK